MADYYSEAARILQGVLEHKGGLKTLSYADEVKHKKASYALVIETLKCASSKAIKCMRISPLRQEMKLEVITEIGEKSRFFELNRLMGPTGPFPLALVMLYDFLIGHGISGGGKLKKTIMQHKNALQSELTRMKIRKGVRTAQELLPEHIRNPVILPRYVRVNTLVTTLDEAIEHFKLQGHALATERNGVPGARTFYEDLLIPSLLVFPPTTDLHNDAFYLSGKLILQDRASCLPPVVLAPPLNSTVIDGCAAPGNKTSFLCALLKGTGKVIAFDKDPSRFALLKRQLTKAHTRNAEAIEGSFLATDPHDPKFKSVQYVQLDPSCSGSGIVSRLDALVDQETEEVQDAVSGRLQQLAIVQRDLVCHAMKFPSVQRVAYSTCSVYEIENEGVVASVLAAQPHFKLIRALPAWPHRGNDPQGHTLRASPATTQTNGFFVALFERVESNLAPAVPPASAAAGAGAPYAHASKEKTEHKENVKKRKEVTPSQEVRVTALCVPAATKVGEANEQQMMKKKKKKKKNKHRKMQSPTAES